MKEHALVFVLLVMISLMSNSLCSKSDTLPDAVLILEESSYPAGEMIFVKGGSFIMGAKGIDSPEHKVSLSPFYLGRYEVTQGEWQQTMGANPATGFGEGERYPVYNVSWLETLRYCNLRSLNEGLQAVYSIRGIKDPRAWISFPDEANGLSDSIICDWQADGYRLPTEAEWEYAAQEGTLHSKNFFYSGSNKCNEVARNWTNTGDTLVKVKYPAEDPLTINYFETARFIRDNHCHVWPVGSLRPNKLGFYDMSGNVFEWTWDIYGAYDLTDQVNPTGTNEGIFRTRRGGSWKSYIYQCYIKIRAGGADNYTSNDLGFRVARSAVVY